MAHEPEFERSVEGAPVAVAARNVRKSVLPIEELVSTARALIEADSAQAERMDHILEVIECRLEELKQEILQLEHRIPMQHAPRNEDDQDL